MEHFGERLRRLRADRPQREVAEELGIPQTTLSSLEKQTSIPRGDVLNRLAEFFGVPITYFYTAADMQPSQAAKNWLQHLKQSNTSDVRETVATHSILPVDASVRERIATKLKERAKND